MLSSVEAVLSCVIYARYLGKWHVAVVSLQVVGSGSMEFRV